MAFPARQPVLAVGVGGQHPVAQHPGHLDVLRVRAQHAAVVAQHLQQPEQEAVVGAGQAQPLALVAADVHEQLGGRHPELGDVARQLGQLLVGADHEVEAEVDARALLGHRLQLVEQRRVGGRAHHVGDEACDPADRRRRGLGVGVRRHPRPRDVAAVPEVQVHVAGARQHGQPVEPDRLGRVFAGPRLGHRQDPAVADQHVRLPEAEPRQQHGAARQPGVDLGHVRFSLSSPMCISAVAVWVPALPVDWIEGLAGMRERRRSPHSLIPAAAAKPRRAGTHLPSRVIRKPDDGAAA